MKRKIFSKLLMGAFLIASVSSFVSCKDYDDDINNLQKQIDAAALKAELTSLQSTLQAQIAAAQSAADKAAAAAQAAQNTANAAATKDALSAVQSAAEKAGADAATAIAAASQAQIAASAAQTSADAAQSTANNAATKDALAVVKATAEAAASKESLEAVKTAAEKAAADAAKAISDAAAAQGTANVAQAAAAAAAEAAKVAQDAAGTAAGNATQALADAAKALSEAAAAQTTANNAASKATDAETASKEAKATAENGVAAAGNAVTQAAEALAAANAAKTAAEAAKYNDEAVRILIDKAQGSADAAAKDAKDAAEAAAAAVIASAAAGDDAAAAKEAAAKVDDAIAKATASIEKSTEAKIQAAVAEAVATAKKEIGEVPADQSAAVEKLTGDLETLGKTVEGLATAKGLEAAVTALEGQISGAADAAAAAAVAAAAGTIDVAVSELYAAITSVELVGSFCANDFNPDKDAQTYPLGFNASTGTWNGIYLDFIFGKQEWTATFGDKETESLDADAVEKQSYKKGDDIRANRALLIRVNPVNAEFTKDQVKFVNSKLETLDEIVEIGEPYRFKGMLTRGTSESGLWVIPVNVKKDITFNKFNETTFYKESGDWKYDKNTGDLETWRYQNKLYAVAIDNTPDMDGEEAIDRFVASTYDIYTAYVHYTPATSLSANFAWTLDNVDYNKNINVIHNRWTSWSSSTDPTWGIRSKDQTNAYTVVPEAMEKRWNAAWARDNSSAEWKAGLYYPTSAEPTKTIKKNVNGKDVENTANDASDERYGYDYLTIANTGDNIKVELTPALQKKVEWWYISYDFELNAVESKPSEWEAWQSYKDGIDGIYTMTRGDKPIDLQINKETAQGDVIGFRIWAVNYDGSLVDPDGKAFYVKVGEEPAAQVLHASAEVKAVNAATGMASNYLTDEDKTFTPDKGYNVSSITKIDGNQFKSLNLGSYNTSNATNRGVNYSTTGFSGNMTVSSYGADDDVIFNGTSVRFYWALLKSDKKTVATDWKDVAYIKAGINGADLINMRDGASLTLITYTGKRNDVNNRETYKLDVTVKKVMPDDAFTKKNFFDGVITWKTDYGWDAKTNVLTSYLKPYYDLTGVGAYLNPNYNGTTKAFNWNWKFGAANLNSIINDEDWLNWDYTVNANHAQAGVRAINDYISSYKAGLDKSLYKWVIEGAPTELGNGAPGTQDYTALWADAYAATDDPTAVSISSVIAVMPKAVREGQKLNSKLKYIYKNISATNKKVNNVLVWTRGDLDRNANSFQTQFADALDLLTYTTETSYLAYDVWEDQGSNLPAIKTGEKVLKDANLYITWKGTKTGQNWVTQVQDQDVPAQLLRLQLFWYSTDPTKSSDMRVSSVGTWNSQTFNPNTYSKFNSVALANAFVSNDLSQFLTSNITTSNKVLAENAKINDGNTIVNGAGVDRDRKNDGTTTSTNPNLNRWNKFAFNENYYKFDNPGTPAVVENAMKIELEGDITTYLKVSPSATPSNLIFQKIGGVQDPHQNISGNIKLSGYDVFGKYHEFKLPVQILYNR